MIPAPVDPCHDPLEMLAIPDRARLSERITKKLLERQAKEKGLDAKLVRIVTGASVVGILRPETIHVPAYRDDERQVTDIPIIQVRLTEIATSAERRRLADLLFRVMPRPVVLCDVPVAGGPVFHLALTHVSRTDPERSTSVVDSVVSSHLSSLPDGALSLDALDRADLWTLYQDLVRRVAGVTRPDLSAEDAVAAHDKLATLQAELEAVIREAKREKGANARIKLNARAKTLRTQIASVKEMRR